MGPRLQDESMRAYDASNIPSLRRPRTNDARIARWVSDCGPRATSRLVRLIAVNPDAASTAARYIRRNLADTTSNPQSTLQLLDQVMRACPYFYRYIANSRFFSTLWSLHKAQTVSPSAREYVLLLVRAWAEDLAAMFFRRSDPPAAFWVEKYQRKRRTVQFPDVPTPPNDRPFVCKVSAGNKRGIPEPGHVMNREELEASLVLLEKLLAAAADDKGWREIAAPAQNIAENVRRAAVREGEDGRGSFDSYQPEFDDPNATLLLDNRRGIPQDNPEARITGLNEKVIAVLRRYDESFARFDPYLSAPNRRTSINCPDVFGELEEFPTNRGSVSIDSVGRSVAAVAREKARWKLSQSASSGTVTTVADDVAWEDSRRSIAEAENPVDNSENVISFPAVTPATFSKYSFPPSRAGSPGKRTSENKRRVWGQNSMVERADKLVAEARTGTPS